VHNLGVIFAGGPRHLAADRAAQVLDAGGSGGVRAGVFGDAGDSEVDNTARTAGLEVIPLHSDPTPAQIARVRGNTSRRVWAAARVAGRRLPASLADLFEAADAVVIDARVPGKLGGAGVPLAWAEIAAEVNAARGSGRLVLAGGLTPENVREAVDTLEPDVVDVSSGIESEPGVKDASRMRAFVQALR
jgi:phosphoribosylanthranilate isomerase